MNAFFYRFSLYCCLFYSVRLSERNGDLGKGILEIYKVTLKKWVPACVSNWNTATSPTMVCSLLGYNSVNSSRITMRNTNQTLTPSTKDSNSIWRMYQRKKTNLIREFGSCSANENHPVIDLTCSNYGKFLCSLFLLHFCDMLSILLCFVVVNFGIYRMWTCKK